MLCAVMLSNGNAASVDERLAERGHPNTKMCLLPRSSKGLGRLLFVQFQHKRTRDQDQQEAIDILKIIAVALTGSGQNYVGFEAKKNWKICLTRDPEYIYWRDYNDIWRLIRKAPVKYLSRIEAELAPDLRGTPAEAFVLFSLGLVEQRLGRIPASIKRFEEAYGILRQTDDRHGIEAFVLVPLIHYHFSEDGDEKQGQTYLNAYALIAEDYEGNYLPLIKVAPMYPGRAQRSGIEGYVVLEFIVDAEGRVQNPVVIDESPEGVFGAAAVEAAKSFRYIPKVVDGVLVPTAGVRNKITFELRQ